MLKVSKEKLEGNRAALVEAGMWLLQERGFDGAGVAEISARAGLTQGAFYSQFKSKSELAAAACQVSHVKGLASWQSRKGKTASDASAFIDQYFAPDHIENVGGGCPMAAYSSEVRRQDESIKEEFLVGFQRMVGLMEEALSADMPRKAARRRALACVSAMSGSLSMARAVAGQNPELAKDIIEAAKAELKRFASNPKA